jgi:hypothetical protein
MWLSVMKLHTCPFRVCVHNPLEGRATQVCLILHRTLRWLSGPLLQAVRLAFHFTEEETDTPSGFLQVVSSGARNHTRSGSQWLGFSCPSCCLKEVSRSQGLVAHDCTPSYSGGREQEDCSSKPA